MHSTSLHSQKKRLVYSPPHHDAEVQLDTCVSSGQQLMPGELLDLQVAGGEGVGLS